MKQRGRATRISQKDSLEHYNPTVTAAWLYFSGGLSQQDITQYGCVARDRIELAGRSKAGGSVPNHFSTPMCSST